MSNVKIVNSHFRLGVGMVIVNKKGQLFSACRSDCANAWQFPQGGVEPDETERDALYRELYEETSLQPQHVECIAQTKTYLGYSFPLDKCLALGARGQVQRWFLLRLLAEEDCINLTTSQEVEFSKWRWVNYWQPLEEIVAFKRDVYHAVLREFANFI